MTRVTPPIRRGLAVAGISLLVLACQDTPVLAPFFSGGGDIPERMVTELQVDPTDTWMSAEITSQTTTTVYTDAPITNPETGAVTSTVTTTSPVEVTNLEGGFDGSGQLRASIRADLDPDPSADPGTQVTLTRIVGDHVEFYDGYGRRVSDYASDGTPLPTLTPEDLWMGNESMVDGSVVTDPAQLERDLRDVAVMSRAPTPNEMLRAIASVSGSIRNRVERPDDATLVVVQEVDDDVTFGPPALAPAASRSAAPTPREGAPRSVAGVATGTSNGKVTLTRTFRRQGSKEFVLDAIRADREDRGASSRAVTSHSMKYRKVKWHKNKKKDDERKMKVKPLTAVVAEAPRPRTAIVMPIQDEPYDPNDPSPGPAPSPAPPPAATSECGGRPMKSVVGSGTGQHLVVQHGFSEDGCLYRASRTRRDLENQFYIDDDLMPTLNYGARIADQSVALSSVVNGARPDGQSSIFIGYSNGGLVSRQLAQWGASNVRGVVTVSTPNSGVPVVKLGYAAVQSVLGPLNFFIPAHVVLGPIVKWLGIGGDGRAVPVLGDVVAGGGSFYLDKLNSAPEQFVRTGVVQRPRQRWLYRRVGATGSCGSSYEVPCGRRAVSDMDNMYAHLKAVTVVHWTWNPFKLASRIAKAVWAGAQIIWYNAIDGLFNFIIAPRIGDGSDGLVPFSSQKYRWPSTPDYNIVGADAHAEAYGSDLVTRTALREVLVRPQYGVIAR